MLDQLKLSPDNNQERKGKDFLLEIMGKKEYEEFIKEGRIEVKSGDSIYELKIDGSVINKSANQVYCVVPKIAGLPLYDVLAIKYAWLKYGYDMVEKVTINRNIQLIHTDNGRVIKNRLIYNDLINYMENNGYRINHIIVKEDSSLINSYENGIKIESPPQMILTIKGYEQDVYRNGYKLWLKCYNKDDNEINEREVVQVIKLNPDIDYSIIWKGYYEFLSVSMTQNISITIGSPGGRCISVAGTPQYFMWRNGVVLNKKECIIIKPENREINIDRNKIKFYMEADVWKK